MRAAFDPVQRVHEPDAMVVLGVSRPHPERVERVDRLPDGLGRLGVEVCQTRDFDAGPRAAVHTPAYLRFLEHAHEEWVALGEGSVQVFPNVHPHGRDAARPDSVVGRAGWHMFDLASPIGPQTYRAACASDALTDDLTAVLSEAVVA